MYAKMAMQDLEVLGDASSTRNAANGLEHEEEFHIDLLDPFNDCHRT